MYRNFKLNVVTVVLPNKLNFYMINMLSDFLSKKLLIGIEMIFCTLFCTSVAYNLEEGAKSKQRDLSYYNCATFRNNFIASNYIINAFI
ncbi:hypothetical protein BpHYR1_045429 [Brachionus plicatilis]|uniref:Uncharacterized protein n=1 Tax=Brachionus plicatilis TaxID=10195 RepID=A0A3M7PKA1_BRAPC|nr:hypothetical protein BpHYR1_045429 [Brachionus plicatilis]